jgi:hypothetical protein
MAEIEDLKAKVKKLSARATTKKMDLHDLSEELPVNWEKILEVAQDTYDTYAALEAARKDLKAAEAAG